MNHQRLHTVYRTPLTVGGILGDVWDVASNAVSSAADVITSVVDRVPGGSWIKGAAESGANWLGDFAKTPTGFFALTVISNNLYGPIANTSLGAVSGMQTVGPQIASVVWAVPGLVAGESFTEAYIKELINRVVALIEYFAGREGAQYANQVFEEPLKQLINNPDFKALVDRVKAELPNLDTKLALKQLHLTPEELSAKFHVRPDVAAAAINGYLHKQIYNVGTPDAPETEYDVHGSPKDVTKLSNIISFDDLNTQAQITPGGGIPLVHKKPKYVGGAWLALPKKQSHVLNQLILVSALTAPAWLTMLLLRKKHS